MLRDFNRFQVKIFYAHILHSQLSVFVFPISPQNLIFIYKIAVIDNHSIGDIVIRQVKWVFHENGIHIINVKCGQFLLRLRMPFHAFLWLCGRFF